MWANSIIEEMQRGASSDYEIDYLLLYKVLSTTESIVNVTFGFLMAIVLVGIPAIVALELGYINIPAFQSAYNYIGRRVQRANKALGLVVRDARMAIKQASTAETGRNVNLTYLFIKMRLLVFTILVLVFFLTGQETFVKIVLNIVKQVFVWM